MTVRINYADIGRTKRTINIYSLGSKMNIRQIMEVKSIADRIEHDDSLCSAIESRANELASLVSIRDILSIFSKTRQYSVSDQVLNIAREDFKTEEMANDFIFDLCVIIARMEKANEIYDQLNSR